MPSVYTIEGASPRRRKKKKTTAQTAHQRRFASAAKKCKGLTATKFRACMRRALKK